MEHRKIILADRQAITAAGLKYILHQMGCYDYVITQDKSGLIRELDHLTQTMVVLDYTLFDFHDVEELLIVAERFENVIWLLFSDDLSVDFIKRVLSRSSTMGILLKDASLSEITDALQYMLKGERFIGQHIVQSLLEPIIEATQPIKLTKTETEIIKDIAMGMTTKEIAEKRYSSFHTVNTHRKNIFRKVGVNNVHELTKYALRAGLVDAAEYYI